MRTTRNYQLPYAEGTDSIKAYPDTDRTRSEKIDSTLTTFATTQSNYQRDLTQANSTAQTAMQKSVNDALTNVDTKLKNWRPDTAGIVTQTYVDQKLTAQDTKVDQKLANWKPSTAGIATEKFVTDRTDPLALQLADSGWVGVDSASGYAYRTGFPGQVRSRGPVVWLRGQMLFATGKWNAGGVRATLPPGFAPSQEVPLRQLVDGDYVDGWIRANGEIFVPATTKTAGNFNLFVSYII